MNAVTAVRDNIRWGNHLLEMVMADVTDEQARWLPPGLAHPIGAIYAHAYLAEDGVLNGMLKGAPPLFATDWAGRIGIPEPSMVITPEWSRALQPDLPALRQYGQAVVAAVEAYLETLTDAGLDHTLDLSSAGLGEQNVAFVLNALIAGHLNNMAGELSVLKGIQGARGYPF
jgi:hypothetical protein